MSWIVQENGKLVAAEAARKKEYEEKRVVLPAPDTAISVILRVNRAPNTKVIDGVKRPGTKFTLYEYDTPDGKTMECFSNLHEKLVKALAPFAEDIAKKGIEFMAFDIGNGGTAQKAKYFVFARGAV